MKTSSRNASEQKIFRDKLREHRGNYYVVYQPADLRAPFAIIQLTFPQDDYEATAVSRAMEQELDAWLRRYPVPAMVSAFDVKDDLINAHGVGGESHLMGYVHPQTGEVVRQWELLRNEDLPSEQLDAEYLARVYQGIPFRVQKEVREQALREARTTGRVIRLIVFFTVVVPVLIEVISVGVTWLKHILEAISILTGLYKAGKAMGWLKRSQRDEQKAEKELKMNHYFYHCERNPEAFNRLKVENFEREAIERTRDEAETIRKSARV